jgi:transposase
MFADHLHHLRAVRLLDSIILRAGISMISPELITRIRHLFYAEHWKIGTIAAELDLHHQTIRQAVETDRFHRTQVLRPTKADPYIEFIQATLQQYPRLRATRIYQMLVVRGYTGGITQLRLLVARLRPQPREAFLRLRSFPGQEAQADWAHFGEVTIGTARRRLSCFVLTLSYSRALFLEFFFDQTLENFLRAHVDAFRDWGRSPRIVLYDNLRSAVLERLGDAIRFHPRLLELAAHYHFQPRACAPARGNQKGRVERAIQYVRDSFFAARPFTTLEDFNRQALVWRDQIAHRRSWPGGDSRKVAEAFEEEKPFLLTLPVHPFDTDLVRPIRSGKTIYVRFDLNDYSIPPRLVGRTLTLVVSSTTIRLLDGTTEVASHPRSYNRHQLILDPAHQDALLEEKRKAFASTAGSRLASAIPESEELLHAAFQRGESPQRQTRLLLGLLDDYGTSELRAAIREALQRQTPRASSVAFILQKRWRSQKRKPIVSVAPSRLDLIDIHVQPHAADIYDELSESED